MMGVVRHPRQSGFPERFLTQPDTGPGAGDLCKGVAAIALNHERVSPNEPFPACCELAHGAHLW